MCPTFFARNEASHYKLLGMSSLYRNNKQKISRKKGYAKQMQGTVQNVLEHKRDPLYMVKMGRFPAGCIRQEAHLGACS